MKYFDKALDIYPNNTHISSLKTAAFKTLNHYQELSSESATINALNHYQQQPTKNVYSPFSLSNINDNKNQRQHLSVQQKFCC